MKASVQPDRLPSPAAAVEIDRQPFTSKMGPAPDSCRAIGRSLLLTKASEFSPDLTLLRKSSGSVVVNKKTICLVIVAGVLLVVVNAVQEVAWRLHTCGISRASLVNRVSVDVVESQHLVNGVTFGYIHDEWEALKSNMGVVDELWAFDNSGPLSGGTGYVVVRLGFPVGCIWSSRS